MIKESGKNNILHIISGMEIGGAEMMLYKLLVNYPDPDNLVNHLVISLSGGDGPVGGQIEKDGIRVIYLDLKNISSNLFKDVILFRKLIQEYQPDLVQAWMYHGNLFSLLSKIFMEPNVPIAWNIRHSIFDITREDISTRLVIYVNKLLSLKADAIVYNSQVSKSQHEKFGFHGDKSAVIPNGIDLQKFRVDRASGDKIRKDLQIPDSAFVIGHVARYHPMKGHDILLNAAKKILNTHKDLHFILVGKGISLNNSYFKEQVNDQFSSRIHLLGERNDIPGIMNSFNVFCSSSVWGEGWPNVIGEALACGVPCLTTDVGDSKLIVDDYGIVVPPDDLTAFVKGLEKLIQSSSGYLEKIGFEGREHIKKNFDITKISRVYADFHKELIKKKSIEN